MIETLNLDQAASLLHMHKETVRERAKAGDLPGAKVGRRWVFIAEDLMQWLRSQYAARRQAVQVTNLEEKTGWHCTVEATSGGSDSQTRLDAEYAALLGL